MRRHVSDPAASKAKARQIVVICEDRAAQEHALQSAPHLAPSGDQTSISVEWLSFSKLIRSRRGADGASKAAEADLLVFAVSPTGDLPQEVKLWIENWISKRQDREGAIVCLIASRPAGELACLKEIYLRHTAHRAGMDYLSRVPSTSEKALSDSPDSYGQRARQVTSVLDEILRSGKQTSIVRP